MEKEGKYMCRRITAEYCISKFSATKAINADKCGRIPSICKQCNVNHIFRSEIN